MKKLLLAATILGCFVISANAGRPNSKKTISKKVLGTQTILPVYLSCGLVLYYDTNNYSKAGATDLLTDVALADHVLCD